MIPKSGNRFSEKIMFHQNWWLRKRSPAPEKALRSCRYACLKDLHHQSATKQTAGTEWGRRLTKAAKHQGPNVVTQVTRRLSSHWLHRRAKQPAGAGENCQGEARAMFRFPWEA